MIATSNSDSVLVPDEATDHIVGPASAKVILIEYADFESPACGRAYALLKIVLKHFEQRVRFVYRHYPQVEIHAHAELAAEAAEAAGAQGHFWPFHDLLYEHQEHLKAKQLREYAQAIGLDLERYDYEMNDHVYLQRVQEHARGGRHLGIRSTPTLYVNGAIADVSFGPRHLETTIREALRDA